MPSTGSACGSHRRVRRRTAPACRSSGTGVIDANLDVR